MAGNGRSAGRPKSRLNLGVQATLGMANLWAIVDSRYDHNQGILARELGMKGPTVVGHWMYADVRPDINMAFRLQTHIGIAFEAWFQPMPKGFRLPLFHARMRAATQKLVSAGDAGVPVLEIGRICVLDVPQVDLLVEALVEDKLATLDGTTLHIVPFPEKEMERLRRQRRSDALMIEPVAA